MDMELRRFLSRSYEFKSAADYFTGSDTVMLPDEAREAIATARRFVAHVAGMLDR